MTLTTTTARPGPASDRLADRTMTDQALTAVKKLESSLDGHGHNASKIIAAMNELRSSIDPLEGLVPHDLWPLPSYAEMMFMM